MIDHPKRKRDPTVSAALALLGGFSVMGLIYCLVELLNRQSAPAYSRSDLLLAGGWFAAASVIVVAIARWKLWGVYLLGAATVLLGAINILQGTATWGGASLALVIAAVVGAYLWPRRGRFE